MRQGVYGAPPPALAPDVASAPQFSPLHPGAQALEALDAESFEAFTALAPPGAAERRYVLAQALRALKAGAPLLALAPKAKGGARLRAEFESFGCDVEEWSKAHHRLCRVSRPAELAGIKDALAQGGPQFCEETGFFTQPGVFSWSRIDPGSRLLAGALPQLCGRGADLGCGYGFLAREILRSETVKSLALIDVDRRATDAARRNVEDARASFFWADATRDDCGLSGLDFVVTNPPFHDAGTEDRALGARVVEAAARLLRKGGTLRLVANRHLPYEATLKAQFRSVEQTAEGEGYKIFEAVK